MGFNADRLGAVVSAQAAVMMLVRTSARVRRRGARIGDSWWKEHQYYASTLRGSVMARERPLQRGQPTSGAVATVVALVFGAVERARIGEALRGRQQVRFVDRISELADAVNQPDRTVTNVIVEARDADRRSTAELISFLRRTRESLPVVGYCRVGLEHSADVRELSVAGVNELLFCGVDDTGSALRAVLTAARQASVGETVGEALARAVPSLLWPFVRHVAMHPNEAKRVSVLATALGYHRKTLVNHCAQANIPPPQELLAWCRLAVVAYLLESTTDTIEAIALQLDFPSDTALRNLMKRYVGLRAGEVRSRGGLACVVAAFQGAIAAQRALTGASAQSDSSHRRRRAPSRHGTA